MEWWKEEAEKKAFRGFTACVCVCVCLGKGSGAVLCSTVLFVGVMCRTVYFLFFFNSMVGVMHQNFNYARLVLAPVKA